ncbi:MAG: hypothetical protein HOV80_29650 [Polyangiaceae bacterium]|nr:hypothetical protein [Polyangiaceae bacterium]
MRSRSLALVAALAACSPGEKAPAGSSATPAVTSSAALSASASSSASAAAARPKGPTTPNEFYAAGTPTFVVGTAGDERSDRAIRTHVEWIRATFFPDAQIVDERSIDTTKGPAGWPKNPVLYGGPHVNWVLRSIGSQLPFSMKAGELELGLDEMDDEGDLAMVTVVPARGPTMLGPGYPSFLLYAGTGTPGIEEINAIGGGTAALFVADAFGQFIVGDWVLDSLGIAKPRFKIAHEREALEHDGPKPVTATLEGAAPSPKGKGSTVTMMSFGGNLEAEQAPQREAIMRGLATAVKKLGVLEPTPITVFLYPNSEKKKKMTRNAGDGHAVPFARTLHVVSVEPKALERLVAHEGTHILAAKAWGPAGSGLWGEGLAVWVAGGYQGVPLEEWKTKITKKSSVETLLGKAFFSMPEEEKYPQAGLFAAAAIKAVGIEKVRDHLYGANSLSWADACKQAGTTPEKLQSLVE